MRSARSTFCDARFRDGDGLVLLVVLVVGAGGLGRALRVAGVGAVPDRAVGAMRAKS